MSKNVIELEFWTHQEEPSFKDKLRAKIRKGKEWVIQNRGLVVTFTPVVISGVATVVKVVGKRINLRKEQSLKELYCYDRSLGHYWKLKRELTNKEWLTIDRRKKNGERLADILAELRVLK